MQQLLQEQSLTKPIYFTISNVQLDKCAHQTQELLLLLDSIQHKAIMALHQITVQVDIHVRLGQLVLTN